MGYLSNDPDQSTEFPQILRVGISLIQHNWNPDTTVFCLHGFITYEIPAETSVFLCHTMSHICGSIQCRTDLCALALFPATRCRSHHTECPASCNASTSCATRAPCLRLFETRFHALIHAPFQLCYYLVILSGYI